MESRLDQVRALPNGKRISSLGFGCSSVWAKPAFSESVADEILQVALAQGINHFDSSPSYGWGEAETRLGKMLARQSASPLVVSTKVGTFKSDGRLVKDFTPARMEHSLTASLARLGVERIDILYLHGAYAETFNDEVFRFFEREKSRGRIDYSGVNSFDLDIIRRFAESPLDVVMLQYNVADLSAVPLLDQLRSRNKTIVAGTILAQGITRLSTFLPMSWQGAWYLARALRKDPAFVLKGLRISRLLDSLGLTDKADPLRFVLADRRVLSGLFGTSKPKHVVDNSTAASKPLPDGMQEMLLSRLLILANTH